MKRPLQFQRLKAVLRSPAVPGIISDALRDIGTACVIAVGYLVLFGKDNDHANRLLWITVLSLDAVLAFIGAIDLRGDSE